MQYYSDPPPDPLVRINRSKTACHLLRYVLQSLNSTVPEWVHLGTRVYNGHQDRTEEASTALEAYVSDFTTEQQNKILYDGRNPDARKLADWWDARQAEIRAKNLEAQRQATIHTLKQSALAKLTPEEKRALLGK